MSRFSPALHWWAQQIRLPAKYSVTRRHWPADGPSHPGRRGSPGRQTPSQLYGLWHSQARLRRDAQDRDTRSRQPAYQRKGRIQDRRSESFSRRSLVISLVLLPGGFGDAAALPAGLLVVSQLVFLSGYATTPNRS